MALRTVSGVYFIQMMAGVPIGEGVYCVRGMRNTKEALRKH